MRCVSSASLRLAATWLAIFVPTANAADVTIYGAAGGHKLSAALTNDDMTGNQNSELIFYSQGASPLGRPGVGLITIRETPAVFPSSIDLATVSGARYVVPPVQNYGPLTRLAVGDFNDDGYGDLAVSTPCRGSNCDGQLYVIPGGVGLPTLIDLQTFAWPIVRVDGVMGSEGYMGYALAVGDVNRDGLDDLVASAPVYYYGDPQVGAIVYVIWGASVFPPIIDLGNTSLAMKIVDPEPGWATGASLACGDVNADGSDDILIGAPGDLANKTHGKAVLVYGGTNLPSTLNLNSPSAPILSIQSDESQPGALGNAVALADVNRDQFMDMAITAHGMSVNQMASCGAVYVIQGGNTLPEIIDVAVPSANLTIIAGTNHNDLFGWSLTAADVTGDGYADVISSSDPLAPDTSVVSVVHGSSSLGDTLFINSASVERYYGSAPNNFGNYLYVGDFNRDARYDFVIAEHRSDGTHCCDSGELHLFFGEVLTNTTHAEGGFLLENYPNPFSHKTAIQFNSTSAGKVKLTIYDVGGRLVREYSLNAESGRLATVEWDGRSADGRSVPSGVYFVRARHKDGIVTRKLILVR